MVVMSTRHQTLLMGLLVLLFLPGQAAASGSASVIAVTPQFRIELRQTVRKMPMHGQGAEYWRGMTERYTKRLGDVIPTLSAWWDAKAQQKLTGLINADLAAELVDLPPIRLDGDGQRAYHVAARFKTPPTAAQVAWLEAGVRRILAGPHGVRAPVTLVQTRRVERDSTHFRVRVATRALVASQQADALKARLNKLAAATEAAITALTPVGLSLTDYVPALNGYNPAAAATPGTIDVRGDCGLLSIRASVAVKSATSSDVLSAYLRALNAALNQTCAP